MTHYNQLLQQEIRKYREKTRKSRNLNNLARSLLPGGDTRTVTYFKPYPLYVREGSGYLVCDVDGNKYIDFLNNYTSLVHGHRHPKIVEAINNQLTHLQAVHAPTEKQIELAKLICERFPSVEMVRFMNSGTEATMNAIRLARAYTGKKKIMKAEGGYHGTHDFAMISVHPPSEKYGSLNNPESVPEDKGIPKAVLKNVIVFPFNNFEVTEKLIKRNKEELAALIVEPIMGTAGIIPPVKDYLKFLREITIDNDVLLVFDEVITARLSKGGAQEYFKVEPDLTASGKMFGGGTPIGLVGGKEEIMQLYSPERKEFLSQSGTFNANPVTMAAGVATLKLLTTQAIKKINSLGGFLKKRISNLFSEFSVQIKVTGVGSLLNIHFTNKEVLDYRSSLTADKDLHFLLYLSLLNRGIWIAPRLMANISTPMSNRETEKFLKTLGEVLVSIKPAIEEKAPHLINKEM